MGALFGPSGNSREFYEAGFKSVKQAMKWVRNYGLDIYEYQGGNGITARKAALREIRLEAELYNIRLSVHAPYYISLANDNPEIRERSLGYIRKSLDAAACLGADIIVVHCGGVGKNDRKTAMDISKQTIASAVENAYSDGISGIKIGLETMGKSGQLGTLQEVLELCFLDSMLVPVVDFGHLYARSLGNSFTVKKDYNEAFDLISSTLGGSYLNDLHCHFSRIEYTKAGEKRHLSFDDTDYGPFYAPFLETVCDYDISPRIICESADVMARDALTMKKYYTELKTGGAL